jgi:hypothetical protein
MDGEIKVSCIHFRQIPFTMYPEWALVEAKEDRVTDTTDNLDRVEKLQVRRFLAWVEDKIISMEPSHKKRRYEMYRACDMDFGPLYIDVIVHKGFTLNGTF